jgi:hypothetical protein
MLGRVITKSKFDVRLSYVLEAESDFGLADIATVALGPGTAFTVPGVPRSLHAARPGRRRRRESARRQRTSSSRESADDDRR